MLIPSSMLRAPLVCFVLALASAACGVTERERRSDDPADRIGHRISSAVGWDADAAPTGPPDVAVSAYARDLVNPRWVYVGPNGDVFVAESAKPAPGFLAGLLARFSRHAKTFGVDRSADRITLLRDADGDGRPELRTIFLEELHSPMGMLVLGDAFYVANTDGIVRFPYRVGQTRIEAPGETIMTLPEDGYDNHWTRNVVAAPDGRHLYVSIGSASNSAARGMKAEHRRANILRVAPDGSGETVYASGLRNPLAMDFEPVTGALWTAVPEREERGDDRIPDYLTRVDQGAFYGWPYAYFGPHPDPARERKAQRPDLIAKTRTPDLSLGAHVSPLGLAFYRGESLPSRYRGGAFVSLRGSWNRSTLAGYKVVFVPFKEGRVANPPEDFLTGFIADVDKSEVHGRPVGLAVAGDGALLLADDAGNTVWRIAGLKR